MGHYLGYVEKQKSSFFFSSRVICVHPPWAALLLGGEKRVNLVTSIFNLPSSPAGPAAVDVPVACWQGSCFLYVSLQPVHINGSVVLVPVLSSLVVRGVSVFPLLQRPDALLQLHQASHVRGAVVLLAARRGRLVAAVLLVLVGHHLLDAYHGLSFTDQRHLEKKNHVTFLIFKYIFH